MKWKKLGKIFDPTEHRLPNSCQEFAQSPQTLVLNDRVRIYFSTRVRDSVGKMLSHVAFVDFSRDMSQLLEVCSQTVMALGGSDASTNMEFSPSMSCVMAIGYLLIQLAGIARCRFRRMHRSDWRSAMITA